MKKLRRAIGIRIVPTWFVLITGMERTLSVQLGIPLYANDPKLNNLGTKSGCREIFSKCREFYFQMDLNVFMKKTILQKALSALLNRHPNAKRAVVKLNDGFSGEGNALFYFDDCKGVDAIEQKENQSKNQRYGLKHQQNIGTLFGKNIRRWEVL